MLVKTDTTLAELAQAQKRTDLRLAEAQKPNKGAEVHPEDNQSNYVGSG